jgi:cyclopropane fatty-acyl-phospholipid synthase-like methyltransferase
MNYKETYSHLFGTNDYSIHDINELRYKITNDYIKKNNIDNMIDVGSGRGVLLELLIKENPHLKILSTDLNKFHNIDLEFKEIDLTKKETFFVNNFQVLTCLDVLEHLEKKYIDDVFKWFANVSETQILTIANHSEIIHGKEIHLIQENMLYWGELIRKYFNIVYYEEKQFLTHLGQINYLYILITKSK